MPVQRDAVARTRRRNWPAEVCPPQIRRGFGAAHFVRLHPCAGLRHCLVGNFEADLKDVHFERFSSETFARKSERIWSHI